MKKYLVELIGTFFFVFVIGLTTKNIVDWQVGEATIFAPLAIGSMLMVMVYMGRHISGAHYNPAVTIGYWVNKKIESKEAISYMVFQIIGAIIAAATIFIFFEQIMKAPAPYRGFTFNIKPVLMEAIFTFALVMVYLNVTVSSKTKGNSYYGLAIGFTLVAAALAGGPVSGGAFNPASAIGPTIIGALFGGASLANLHIYLIGPLLGGLAAGYVFKYLENE